MAMDLRRPRRLAEPLSERLQVSLTPAERERLAAEATRAGYRSLAGYARERLLAGRGPDR